MAVKKQPGRQTVLSVEQEKELLSILQDMESHLFGLTVTDVRRIVFVFCEKNVLSNTFSRNDGMAGRKLVEIIFQSSSFIGSTQT